MSGISQGEGWWMANDQKWYPPELHPDYEPDETTTELTAAPTVTVPGGFLSTSAVQEEVAHEDLDEAEDSHEDLDEAETKVGALAGGASSDDLGDLAGSGPSDISAIEESDTGVETEVREPGDGTKQPIKKKKLFMFAALALVVLGAIFAASRLIPQRNGASSPEQAAEKLVSALLDRDYKSAALTVSPSELDPFHEYILKPLTKLKKADEDDVKESENVVSYWDLFDIEYDGGRSGAEIEYFSRYLDREQKIAQAGFRELRILLTPKTDPDIGGDSAVVRPGSGKGVDIRDLANDELVVTLRRKADIYEVDIHGILMNESVDYHTEEAVDLIFVQDSGKWYFSPGYTLSGALQDVFGTSSTSEDSPQARYGTASRLIEDGRGGAASPDWAVTKVIESYVNDQPGALFAISDPKGVPYLHDQFAELIDESHDLSQEGQGRYQVDKMKYEIHKWKGRSVARVEWVDLSTPNGRTQDLDFVDFCIDTSCLYEEQLTNSGVSYRNWEELRPGHMGVALVSHGDRWFLDPIATAGYFLEQVVEFDAKVRKESEDWKRPSDLRNLLDMAHPEVILDLDLGMSAKVINDNKSHSFTPAADKVAFAIDPELYRTTRVGKDRYSFAMVQLKSSGSYTPVSMRNDNHLELFRDLESREFLISSYMAGSATRGTVPSFVFDSEAELNVKVVDFEVIQVGSAGYEGSIGNDGRPVVVFMSDFAGDITGRRIKLENISYTRDDPENDFARHWNTGVEEPRLNIEGVVKQDLLLVIFGEPGSTFEFVPRR